MLNIGSKKYRNMQEQIAYNTECIEELAKAIDGITLEDKLVLIANDSGTFSPEELDILSMPLAFISNGSRVWIKDSETLTEFVYKAIDIKATEVGSAYFEIGGSKIVITRATGAFVVSDDLIITTYSKSQLDSIVANIMSLKADKSELTAGLALKANVSGQAFSGPISAPEVLETMSGYSGIIRSISNATLNHIYVGAAKTGNKFTIVDFFSVIKTEGTNVAGIVLNLIIPESVGQKLIPYTVDGVEWIYQSEIAAFSSAATNLPCQMRIRKNSNTSLDIIITLSNPTLNTEYYARFEATFLLGNSLVS